MNYNVNYSTYNLDLPAKPETFLRRIEEYDKKLRRMLRTDSAMSLDIIPIRKKFLKETEILVLNDPKFASIKQIEQFIWKPCFYKCIEDFRRRIRKYAIASASSTSTLAEADLITIREHLHHITTEFRLFLDESTHFYTFLLNQFKKRLYSSSSAGTSGTMPERKVPSRSDAFTSKNQQIINENEEKNALNKLRQSCYHCLVFLGDLARYRELHSEKVKKDYSLAESYYYKALVMIPENGNPHNQLAVLAMYVDAECTAVYRYCRSLMVSNPFTSSQENLVLLLNKNFKNLMANFHDIRIEVDNNINNDNNESLVSMVKSLNYEEYLKISTCSPKGKGQLLKRFLQHFIFIQGVFYLGAIDEIEGEKTENDINAKSEIKHFHYLYDLITKREFYKVFHALLEYGVIGDTLLLRIIVICIFMVLKTNELHKNFSRFSSHLEITHITTGALQNSCILFNAAVSVLLDVVTTVMEFLISRDVGTLLQKQPTLTKKSKGNVHPIRYLGPISVFCDFIHIHHIILEDYQTIDTTAKFNNKLYETPTYIANPVQCIKTFLNAFSKLGNLLIEKNIAGKYNTVEKIAWKAAKEKLRENIELRGFIPLIGDTNESTENSGTVPSTTTNDTFTENEALMVRAKNIIEFGKWFSEKDQGEQISISTNEPFVYLHFNLGRFSISSHDSIPLSFSAAAGRNIDYDYDEDEDLIVFQAPSNKTNDYSQWDDSYKTPNTCTEWDTTFDSTFGASSELPLIDIDTSSVLGEETDGQNSARGAFVSNNTIRTNLLFSRSQNEEKMDKHISGGIISKSSLCISQPIQESTTSIYSPFSSNNVFGSTNFPRSDSTNIQSTTMYNSFGWEYPGLPLMKEKVNKSDINETGQIPSTQESENIDKSLESSKQKTSIISSMLNTNKPEEMRQRAARPPPGFDK